MTNFDISRYDVKSIANSNLPVGGMSNKSNNKTSSDSLSDNKSADGSNRTDDRDHSSATSVSFASQPSTSTLSFALPMKQDSSTSDFWSTLSYHNTCALNNNNAKNPPTAIPLFQNSTPNGTTLQCTAPAFNVDFPTTNNNGFFNGGGYFLQHHQSNLAGNVIATTSSSPSAEVPHVTRIAIGSNGTSTCDGTNFGNWISPSLHSFQPAKPSFIPIFGME